MPVHRCFFLVAKFVGVRFFFIWFGMFCFFPFATVFGKELDELGKMAVYSMSHLAASSLRLDAVLQPWSAYSLCNTTTFQGSEAGERSEEQAYVSTG